MSRGTAMSTMNIGRRRRARMAASTARLVMTGTGLAVQLMTMSAPASSLSRSLQGRGVGVEFGGQRFGLRHGAVGDDHALDARAHEMPRGQRIHVAGADQQGVVSAQVLVHAPRQADRRRGQRYGIGADAGFGAHAFGGRKSGLKQLVEDRPGAAAFLRDAVRVLQLARGFAPRPRPWNRGPMPR